MHDEWSNSQGDIVDTQKNTPPKKGLHANFTTNNYEGRRENRFITSLISFMTSNRSFVAGFRNYFPSQKIRRSGANNRFTKKGPPLDFYKIDARVSIFHAKLPSSKISMTIKHAFKFKYSRNNTKCTKFSSILQKTCYAVMTDPLLLFGRTNVTKTRYEI